MESADAEKALKDRGFSTKRATQLWRSDKADEVIGQTPAAGQKVAPQSEVTYLGPCPSHVPISLTGT
jgi:beta-lactam-binding protein with PASTA domain